MISFRAGLISEQSALVELQRRASLVWEDTREALLAHPEVIVMPEEQLRQRRVIVCELDGAVVGFAVVLPRPDGDAELDGLFVEPSCWRSGMGRRLVGEAEKMARRERARRMHVLGNPNAAQFYLACGFEVEGKTQTEFGPGILMSKPI